MIQVLDDLLPIFSLEHINNPVVAIGLARIREQDLIARSVHHVAGDVEVLSPDLYMKTRRHGELCSGRLGNHARIVTDRGSGIWGRKFWLDRKSTRLNS